MHASVSAMSGARHLDRSRSDVSVLAMSGARHLDRSVSAARGDTEALV